MVAIANHLDAIERYVRAVDRKNELAVGSAEREGAIEEVEALVELEDDTAWEILAAKPTTFAGVVGLLNHLGQDRFLSWYDFDEEDDFDKLLTSWSKDRAEEVHPRGDMDTWEKRHAVAQRHVDTGRRAIDHQRSIVASQKAHRLNSEASQDLLTAIERSQQIFESNLARLLAERGRDQTA